MIDPADFLRVSALDLATVTGLAYGTGVEPPVLERWDLRIGGNEDRGLQLMRKLSRHLDEYRPHIVYVERSLAPAVLAQIGATAETNEFLAGIVFLAKTILRSRKTLCEVTDRQKVLKHFVGASRFAKKGDAKKAVKVRCKQLGWAYQDDNDADAAALWDFGVSYQNPKAFMLAAQRRPLPRIGT